MDYEDELQQMQEDALKELDEETNDTNPDDTGHEEESVDTTDNTGEDAEDGSDFEEDGDENESDIERNKREDAESFDEEDENLDGDDSGDEGDDDTSSGKDSNTKKSDASFEPVEVEVNGQQITLDTQEELLSYIKNKGSGSSKRQRKSDIDQIAEQGDISKDDLKLFIDAKNGDPAAIARIAQKAKIDIYDLNEEQASEYSPKFQERLMTEVDEVAADIMEDTALYTDFTKVVATVPDSFKATIASDPKALTNFSKHIKSGLAQEVIPMVIKEQALRGGDFMDLYAKIGREVSEGRKDPKENKKVRKVDPRAEKLRKQAKNPKGSNKGTKTKQTGDDIWNMSTEDFAKRYM